MRPQPQQADSKLGTVLDYYLYNQGGNIADIVQKLTGIGLDKVAQQLNSTQSLEAKVSLGGCLRLTGPSAQAWALWNDS